MSKTTRPKVIFFDLDGTLFDDNHSLQCAINTARRTVDIPDTLSIETLTTCYLIARTKTHDLALQSDFTAEQIREKRTRHFFSLIGLSDYGEEQVKAFDDTYKKAYQSSRRATPGTIETLTKLREMGYKIAIITNGSEDSQQDKINQIGIAHLVDRLFASWELGWAKPDSRIFHHAMGKYDITPEMLKGKGRPYMIGDDMERDVHGAMDAGMDAIIYSPACAGAAPESSNAVPVIFDNMTQLLSIMKEDARRKGRKNRKSRDDHWYKCTIF
ncbi:hypothetical protein FPOA_08887 [Fusarium poae]|uniref:Uncharacterized protein n=1 Tax=Fusarium poae TaxID=36050 RepID=A0A1B8APV9_FUSPO|nr:hypothetical protein FPOA_08887 [Fusarium poae]